jgi:hypothetical protein
MWAQGLTVGTLIGSAVLSGVTTTENKVVEGRADHSWADILGTYHRGSTILATDTDKSEQEGNMKRSELDKIRGNVEEATK